jgi:hypothetical protein
LVLSASDPIFSQDIIDSEISINGDTYPVFPNTIAQKPGSGSPIVTDDGEEILVASTKRGEYALVPVTIENGSPLHYSSRVGTSFGKDNQLQVDSGDFPTLAKTGLHSEPELDTKVMITGYPISLISYIGRPQRFSFAGFMAEDEDILSILRSDNRTVAQLGLTHPQLARPLFHVWNLILAEIEAGTMKRFPSIQHFYYNGKEIKLNAESGKGWQVSIFQDEIQGRFNIQIRREMSRQERSFLTTNYSDLPQDRLQDLFEKLTFIQFSEMNPYYIMRYGFYEGHTVFRTDPVAIAFLFGLKTLEDFEEAFPGDLYHVLTDHFVAN